MSKVLFVLTSHGELGDSGRPTGFHLGETAEPWRILRDAGHEVDLVSVRGGRPPVTGYDADCPAHTAFLADSEGGALLDSARTPEETDPGEYAAVYFVGGHGTMWDFRGNQAVESLARRVYEAGGIVAAVCHGPAALVDVRLSDGSHLVAGRNLTSFADAHERARGLDGVVPFLLQRALEERGAVHTHAPDRLPHVVVDGRLVTGQNPASARALGERLADLLGAGGAGGTAPVPPARFPSHPDRPRTPDPDPTRRHVP
ncbi:dihydroxyacetone kinase [Streptomyces ruber]|uniref:Dihydroxyacetone kinase n=2 Tax=Streptomyces TaxID=1883 RepID=A0A918ERN8_9ACTN|nr:type 1 glutamine amidotransferase domain-containing protein [Streptomyces ruber]GGQ47994.1 dihydroxyacetone kinase [Streptomyces ruber]